MLSYYFHYFHYVNYVNYSDYSSAGCSTVVAVVPEDPPLLEQQPLPDYSWFIMVHRTHGRIDTAAARPQ